jgi:hypothetical protein
MVSPSKERLLKALDEEHWVSPTTPFANGHHDDRSGLHHGSPPHLRSPSAAVSVLLAGSAMPGAPSPVSPVSSPLPFPSSAATTGSTTVAANSSELNTLASTAAAVDAMQLPPLMGELAWTEACVAWFVEQGLSSTLLPLPWGQLREIVCPPKANVSASMLMEAHLVCDCVSDVLVELFFEVCPVF